MGKRLRKARKITDTVPSAHELRSRVDESREEVQLARKPLEALVSGDADAKRRNISIIALQGISNSVDLSASDISLLLSQRVMSSLLRKREKRHVKDKTLRFFTTPRQTKIVMSKFLKECTDSIYGRDFVAQYRNLTPIATIWPHPEYRYSWFSRAISVPPHDSTKMCRFSSLTHEVCHSKIRNILNALKGERKPDERLAAALLGTDWESIDVKWGRLEKRFVNLVNRELRRTYSSLFSHLGDKSVVSRQNIAMQFVEVLCDVATTKICGPADVFMLGWTSAPFCRAPGLGVCIHLLDLHHPPDIVRLRYEMYALQTGRNDLRGTPKFQEIFDAADSLIGFDLASTPKGKWTDLQRLSDHLIGAYTSIVLRLFENDIDKLVNSVMGDARQFDRDRWKGVVNAFEELNAHGKLSRKNLQPYDLANVAWLKVMDIFEKTIKRGLTYKDFWRLRNNQRSFFKCLWDYIVRN